jgi:hypothetical protein
VLVGDCDRDRAAAALRDHFVGGRLTLEEFSARTERVLSARSRAQLWGALEGLPLLPNIRELAREGRLVARTAARGAVLVLAAGAWFCFSLVLLLVLALTLLIDGASTSVLVGFLVVWLVPTYLLSRMWHRTPLRGRSNH